MDIELTHNGKKQIIKDVDIGGQIQIIYYTQEGKKMVYYLKITNNSKAVLN